MVNPIELLEKALASPNIFRFSEACQLAKAFGFKLSRVKGIHHEFAHPKLRELINLQDVNGTAKPYQLRQRLQMAERHNLSLEKKE